MERTFPIRPVEPFHSVSDRNFWKFWLNGKRPCFRIFAFGTEAAHNCRVRTINFSFVPEFVMDFGFEGWKSIEIEELQAEVDKNSVSKVEEFF